MSATRPVSSSASHARHSAVPRPARLRADRSGNYSMFKKAVLVVAAVLVRQGDDRWFNLVKWVNFAMINAEELGVTSKNADEKAKSESPDIRRLLGFEGNFGEALGLDPEWAYRIVKLVGNYGEIFDRNLGEGSPLQIKRGMKALWSKGGLLYAPPIQ